MSETPNSLTTGADGQANHLISVLRHRNFAGPLENAQKLMPGFALHAAPEMGLTGTFRSPVGRVLELDVTVAQPDGWYGLHLDLPFYDLSQAEVLGVLFRGAAPEDMMLKAALRTGTEDGFIDTFFDKHILFHTAPSVHLDALTLPQRADLPLQAPWRQLVLFLPAHSFQLSLHDIRVFLI